MVVAKTYEEISLNKYEQSLIMKVKLETKQYNYTQFAVGAGTADGSHLIRF